MSSPLRMRPAVSSDFEALFELAEESGPGFTSLPVDEGVLRKRLAQSERSFAGDVEQPAHGRYLMMLENIETGEIGGCCAVKAGTGIKRPFFNYRIITVAQASREADRRFDLDALILTNEFIGYTEVGTLFLRKSFRGSGAGHLVAQCRYLLMAAAPDKFGDMVLAELRGVVDETGRAPFWDHLGQHFFRMSFTEADLLSAVTDNQFILDLMPKYPIYVDLLPDEAREVIGRCHSDGVPALKLLEKEGFRFDRVVDIFDGGPIVVAPRRMIRTVRESRRVRLEVGDATGEQGLVSRAEIEGFRATFVEGEFRDETHFVTSQETLDKLELSSGDDAMIWLRTDR